MLRFFLMLTFIKNKLLIFQDFTANRNPLVCGDLKQVNPVRHFGCIQVKTNAAIGYPDCFR